MTDPLSLTAPRQPAATRRDAPRASLQSLPALTGAGLADVLAERIRQIDVEGFTLAHDMGHHPGELALAGASYINTAIDQLHGTEHPATAWPDTWPWQGESWRPGTARENIVKGTAILLATLDRLDGETSTDTAS